MLDDIHDYEYQDREVIRQFDDYLDINSQNFNNFKPIPEYHCDYEEFPTVYIENVSEIPEEKEEKKERKKERKSEEKEDSSSSRSSSGSSSGASSSASGSASGSASASASASAASVSASAVVSAAFVAVVAVSAVVLPIVENADLDVDMQVEYCGSFLTYAIILTNASESSNYYVVVLEDQTVVSEKLIVGGQLSDTITGLNGSKQHRVEVRTGTPPLYSVGSETIPGQDIWVEWNDTAMDYHSIDFTITLHGYGGPTMVTVADPDTGATVYSREIVEGESSGSIGNLKADHGYEFTVSSESQTYLSTILNTKAPQVTVDHISVKENVIDYGIKVEGDIPMMMTLYDSETMAAVYSTSLSEGMNSGAIEELKFEHGYMMEVKSDNKTYLTEQITTEPAMLEIEVVALDVKETTLTYDIDVKGDKKVATMEIYGKESGETIYSRDLQEGRNAGEVTDLKNGQVYVMTIYSGDTTYVTEEIITDVEVKVTSVKAVKNSVEYEIEVKTGSRIVTMHLLAGEDLREVYTLDLEDGTNTGSVGDLDYGQLYTLTVTCEDTTYATETVTTEINVESFSLSASGNSISYDVNVQSEYEAVTLAVYLSKSSGPVYTKTLDNGRNSGTVGNLQYQRTYTVEILTEEKTYTTKTVTTGGMASILTAVNGEKLLTIVELVGIGGMTIGLYSDESCTTAVVEPVSATKLVDLYTFDVVSGETYYIGVKDTSVGGLQKSQVTVTESDPLTITDSGLKYTVTMMDGYTGTAILKDNTSSITVTLPDLSGTYANWTKGHSYTLQVSISEVSATVDLDTIDTADIQYTIDGDTIEYTGTVSGTATKSIYLYKSGGTGYIAEHNISGTVSGSFTGLENGATYTMYVNEVNASDPTTNYNWKSEDIKISSVSIDAYVTSSDVMIEVTFVGGASSDGTIGLYNDDECTSGVEDVQFKQGATSSIVTFQKPLASGTYYIGVYVGTVLEAVKEITIQ